MDEPAARPSHATGAVLPRAFYARPTLEVASGLLGKVLVHVTAEGTAAGVIVEAEAYIGEDDPACHAAPGPTRRNEPLYGPPGFAYVYLNYGIHCLTNAVTEEEGRPAAVLFRALDPIEGTWLMERRRGAARDGAARDGTPLPRHALCRGPGNLSRALGITLADNRADLCDGRLVVEDRGIDPGSIRWTPRIGIRVGTEHAWRCHVDGHPAVSAQTARGAAVSGRGCR